MNKEKFSIFLASTLAVGTTSIFMAILFGISLAAEMSPQSLEYILMVDGNWMMTVMKVAAVMCVSVIVAVATIILCRKTEDEVADQARMERSLRSATEDRRIRPVQR